MTAILFFWSIVLPFLWIVCGFVAYAATYAYYQRKWPSLADQQSQSDWRFSVFVGAAGPMGLLAAISHIDGFRYGLMWRRQPRNEKVTP